VQFYFAVSEDGNTNICGTQAEASGINKVFEPVDIPVDKAGLKAWIQQMLDETINATPAYVERGARIEISDTEPKEFPEEEIHNTGSTFDTEPEPKPVEVKVVYQKTPLNIQNIMEWVLDVAGQPQVEQLFSAIGARFGELVRAERNVPKPAPPGEPQP
jgi:hypothetical protein